MNTKRAEIPKHPISLVERFEERFGTYVRDALVAVSLFVSVLGLGSLYDLAGAQHSEFDLTRYLIPLSFASALHVLIVQNLRSWRLTHKRKFVLGALPFQLMAVIVSYGIHWRHFNAENFTIESFPATQTSIERSVRAYAQAFEILDSQMAALAAHSHRQAEIEERSGTSCGYFSGRTQGPRYKLRKKDEVAFAGLRDDIATRRTKIADVLHRLDGLGAHTGQQAVAREAALRGLVNEIKTIEADPLIPEFRKSIETRLTKSRGAISLATGSHGVGQPTAFICPDAELERRGQAVIDAIGSLRPIPEVAFSDARDARNGYVLALGRLYDDAKRSMFGAPRRGGVSIGASIRNATEESNDLTSSPRDILPLCTAAAIELALIFLFRPRGGAPLHAGLVDLADTLDRGALTVLDRLHAAMRGNPDDDFRDLLYRHTVYFGGRTLVLVPVYTNDPQRNALHQMMEILCAVDLARPSWLNDPRLWLRRRLIRHWPETQAERVLAAPTVRVYVISRSQFLALVLDALRETSTRTEDVLCGNATANTTTTHPTPALLRLRDAS